MGAYVPIFIWGVKWLNVYITPKVLELICKLYGVMIVSKKYKL